jgi:glutamate-1-semialdehyde 2,1-aminomutase
MPSIQPPSPRATPIDTVLRARVVPGGMTGHLNAAVLPPGYPQFFERAHGYRLWDVDGREFIDFMCSWGPNLLGHHHRRGGSRRRAPARAGRLPQRAHRAFGGWPKRPVARIAHADWVMS